MNRTLSAMGRSPVVVKMTLLPRRARVVRTSGGIRTGEEASTHGHDGMAADRHRGGAGGRGGRDQGRRHRMARPCRAGKRRPTPPRSTRPAGARRSCTPRSSVSRSGRPGWSPSARPPSTTASPPATCRTPTPSTTDRDGVPRGGGHQPGHPTGVRRPRGRRGGSRLGHDLHVGGGLGPGRLGHARGRRDAHVPDPSGHHAHATAPDPAVGPRRPGRHPRQPLRRPSPAGRRVGRAPPRVAGLRA